MRPYSGRERMYHCHILEHEDLGMMGMLDVEPWPVRCEGSTS